MDTYPFFTAEPLMEAGPGFETFGPGHLVSLALCVVGIALLVRTYVRLDPGLAWRMPRRRALLAIGGAMVGMRISHDVLCLAAGSFGAIWWPLHVCNLCELLCFAYALRPGRALGLATYGLALPSGTLALLFPGWTYCPLLTWASVCGFAEHACLVAFALMLACGGEVHPRLRDSGAPLGVLVCYLAATIPFNHAMGTNFGFTNWPIPGTPLVAFARVCGTPGYLVPYGAGIAALVCGIFAATDHFGKRMPDR